MDLKQQIINDINENPIILYMKGTKDMPMCGFSATVVKILDLHNVSYEACNILDKQGYFYESHLLTDLEHTISNQTIDLTKKFIKKCMT